MSKIKVEIDVKLLAKIFRLLVIDDSKHRPNGMEISIEVNDFLDSFIDQLTEEDRDFILGEVLEIDSIIHHTTKN